MTTANQKKFYGTGKRKNAIARVFLVPGEGKFSINGKHDLDSYFGRSTYAMIVQQPFEVTGNSDRFDVQCTLKGGGTTGQAEALRHGISKALLSLNADYRKPLRKSGFLTRDSRVVERKKYGQKKARKSTQFSKR